LPLVAGLLEPPRRDDIFFLPLVVAIMRPPVLSLNFLFDGLGPTKEETADADVIAMPSYSSMLVIMFFVLSLCQAQHPFVPKMIFVLQDYFS
tara:strand:- start:17 stop:292 length:276 start_codon:yes stop_codon:yes gene_type:complete